MAKSKAIVGIIMGSDSDLPIMKQAAEILNEFNVSYEMLITSAHRTPDLMASYSKSAYKRGIKVIIAGAGGAAHLPGMSAAYSPIPVIGVPIETKSLKGLDSLLSIAQMPYGVPVATVAINNAKNAALLAVQILGTSDKKVLNNIIEFKKKINLESKKKNKKLQK
ncbi:MAG: 5-(carboxyamino)imidazole ribonucleotide mutase [Ignavibacteria bacterium]|nr:5-(carboxyamino)imidazole ribonucleotide mutase [Ignavibacteria bacterium]